MIWFIAGPLIAAVLVGLWWLGHSPYGYVRLSEFPALFYCLLAGKEHRAEFHRIMVARKRHGDADPREAMRALADRTRMERDLFGEALEQSPDYAPSTGGSMGGPIQIMVAEHAKPVGHAGGCRDCGSQNLLARGRCMDCYREWKYQCGL